MRNYKKLLISLIVASFSAFPVSAFAENSLEAEVSQPDLSNVKVIHQESQEVSDSKLAVILNTARESLAAEKSSSLSLTADNTTYDYITYDDQYAYFYEEAANSTPELLVVEKSETNIESILENEASAQSLGNNPNVVTPLAGPIDDGVGGRVSISPTGGANSYLSAQMKLPTSNLVSTDSAHTAYNYGGFEYTSSAANGIGSWAADMGLGVYTNLGPSRNAHGWKPLIILKKKNRATTKEDSGWDQYKSDVFPDDANKEGQYLNGYKPDTSPVMYFWYNYNGKVRMKIDGTTICPTREGLKLADTHNITILESSASWNISSISKWKLLSTVVSTDDTGKNKAVYSSIKINGTAVPSSSFSSPVLDHAYVTRDSNNTVTIIVDSSLY